MHYLLAHDLGTSSDKAALYDENGRLILSRKASYPSRWFGGNRAEQDAADWWQAVTVSTRALLADSGIAAADIAAVSFSGHMTGCLAVDSGGRPLRPHILWADGRAAAEASSLDEAMSAEAFYRITGHRNNATTSLAKMLWIKGNEPDIYDRTAFFLNAKDYLVFKMCGRFVTDPSDAGATTLFDIVSKTWSEEMIARSGIDARKLPPVLPSTAVVGEVSAQAANDTGLAQGTAVVLGGGDGLLANVGAGCVSPGRLHASLGTSVWFMASESSPFADPKQRTFNFCHVVPEQYAPTATMQSAGESFAWWLEMLGVSGAEAIDRLEREWRELEPGSGGVLFLPYLLGERAPYWNPEAKGAFLGLKRETTRADMVRAVLEGVTLHMNLNLGILDPGRHRYQSVNLVGGGARSDAWCQMMADAWQLEVRRLASLGDAGSAGAAVVAGVGVGLFDDFSVVDRFVDVEKTFSPDPRLASVYDELTARLAEAYEATKPFGVA